MASYGKQEYWEQRYTRDSSPCEWIAGYDLLSHLLSPSFLCLANAPSPSGEIRVQDFNHWLTNHLGPLLGVKNDPSCVIDEESELEYCTSMGSEFITKFPSREEAKVLHVGCGTSSLSADLVYHGWMDIVNIDYSKTVIEAMKAKYGDDFYDNLKSCVEYDTMLRHTLGLECRDDDESPQDMRGPKPSMKFECADITKGINYPDKSFDLIICKKTLDVILCSAGSVASARAMISECFRLLNDDHGVMMILSSGKPEDRAVFFENDPWTGVLNVKLPMYQADARKSHHRKMPENYVYILYKQDVSAK